MTHAADGEINRLVHEEVLGFCVHEWDTVENTGPDVFFGEWAHACEKCDSKRVTSGFELSPVSGFAPPYQTDISASWSVLQYYVDQGFGVRVDQPFQNGRWRAEIYSKSRAPYSSPVFGRGYTAPEAICNAALLKSGVVLDSMVPEQG